MVHREVLDGDDLRGVVLDGGCELEVVFNGGYELEEVLDGEDFTTGENDSHGSANLAPSAWRSTVRVESRTWRSGAHARDVPGAARAHRLGPNVGLGRYRVQRLGFGRES